LLIDISKWIKINERTEKTMRKDEECRYIYQVCQTLYKEVSKALLLLDKKDMDYLENTIQILEKAHYETGEMLISGVHKEWGNDLSAEISERLNLQSIGYYVKEGGNTKVINTDSFTERGQKADMQLDKELNDIIGEKEAEEIYPVIADYVSAKEEIQFSLGMKIGARIAFKSCFVIR